MRCPDLRRRACLDAPARLGSTSRRCVPKSRGGRSSRRRRARPPSLIFTAASRSTETSCETPRSAMVTPNRRFMRAMVIGLWVMMTKRVSVEPRHLVEQVAEALDVVIVERRVDLVQHADRRRIGEEHREDQRQRGQRLLAAGEQRQRRGLLARRLGQDLEAGFERIVALDQLQFGGAAAEQLGEQPLEVAVDDLERGRAAARAPRG